MKTLFIVLVLFLSSTLTSCIKDSPYVLQPVITKMEQKGNVRGHKLGINEEGEFILQKEENADSELMIQQNVNLAFEDELRGESFQLERCRTELADPRLGGSGEVPKIMDVDNMSSVEKVREAIGLTEKGEAKVVKKTKYLDILYAERQLESTLRSMIYSIKQHKKVCLFKMNIARRKAGLPSMWVQGWGYYDKKGNWIQTQPDEGSLDDAFEEQARRKNLKSQERKEASNED